MYLSCDLTRCLSSLGPRTRCTDQLPCYYRDFDPANRSRAACVFLVIGSTFILTLSIDDEIQHTTALRWLAEFLTFAQDVIVPFTPRLIPAILPNLAHHVQMIQTVAVKTNKLLLNVIQKLPSPSDTTPPKAANDKPLPANKAPRSPTPTATAAAPNPRQGSLGTLADGTPSGRSTTEPQPSNSDLSRPHSPVSFTSQTGVNGAVHGLQAEDTDPFDYQATVNELTVQFLSEYEETRVAALKWLIMLHQKAPKKVCILSHILQV